MHIAHHLLVWQTFKESCHVMHHCSEYVKVMTLGYYHIRF